MKKTSTHYRIAGYITSILGVCTPFALFAQTPGTLDTSFDPGVGPYPLEQVYNQSTAIQSDNKIIIGGSFTNYDNTPVTGLVRLNTDGSLDNSFIFHGLSGHTAIGAIILQSNGKAVIVDDVYDGIDSLNYVLRLNTNGSVDSSFTTGILNNNGYVSVLRSHISDKIFVMGDFTGYNGESHNGVIRLNSNGTIDNTFNAGAGPTVNDTVGGVRSAVVQSDGKLIIVGDFTGYDGISRNGIARINLDGSLDTGFVIGSGFDDQYGLRAMDVALQSNGKVVVIGLFTNYNGTTRNGIVRLNTDGSLDTSFDPGAGSQGVMVLIIQSDGKIVVDAGNTYDGQAINRIARLNVDGSLDTGFVANAGAGFDAQINSLHMQSDGKIMAIGYFNTYDGVARANIARIYGITMGSGLNDCFEITTGNVANNQGVYDALCTAYDNVPAIGQYTPGTIHLVTTRYINTTISTLTNQFVTLYGIRGVQRPVTSLGSAVQESVDVYVKVFK